MAIDRTPVLSAAASSGSIPRARLQQQEGIEASAQASAQGIRVRRPAAREAEGQAHLRRAREAVPPLLRARPRMNGVTGENLMVLLESRLDNVVFRLGFARTRREARQTVRHGHFTVNGRRVDIPSYLVKPGDVIAVGEKYRDLLPIKEALISSPSASRSPAGSRSISRSSLATCSRCPRASRSAPISTSSSSSSSTLSSPSGLLRLEVNTCQNSLGLRFRSKRSTRRPLVSPSSRSSVVTATPSATRSAASCSPLSRVRQLRRSRSMAPSTSS